MMNMSARCSADARPDNPEPYRGPDDAWVFPPAYTNALADPVEDMTAQALGTHPDAGVNALTLAEHDGRAHTLRVVEVGEGVGIREDDRMPTAPARVVARVMVAPDGSRRIVQTGARAGAPAVLDAGQGPAESQAARPPAARGATPTKNQNLDVLLHTRDHTGQT
jgi:hypothetical protein